MPLSQLGAVIMVGEGGTSPQERLLMAAQRACAIDLIDVLQSLGIHRIVLAAPRTDWLPRDLDVICDDDGQDGPFHFGERLANLIEHYELEPALYFGGASAPLLDSSFGSMLLGLLEQAMSESSASIPSHIVLTNNLHSSDWVAISRVGEALPVIREATRDNSLAWLLQESEAYSVRVLSGVRPATSMDLDTPSDLALLARHPDVRPALQGILSDELLNRIPVGKVIDVIARDGSTVALIGRVAPLAWQALNKATRCWTRVIAEERGMVASGKLERGEVRSALVPWSRARGLDGFFQDLAGLADAAIFDSRVFFAAQGCDPDAADRFASDLFWID